MWTFSRLSVQMLHGKDRSRDIHTTDHGCYGQGYWWALIPPLIDDHLTATETRWLQASEKKGASVVTADQRLPGVWTVCVYGNAYVLFTNAFLSQACAHRWKNVFYESEHILPHGYCSIIPPTLQRGTKPLIPCYEGIVQAKSQHSCCWGFSLF